jgi:hypothetical protein
MSKPAAAPKKGAKGGTTHLSARERRIAISLWERGEVTLEELGRRFKRTPGAFAKFFSTHKIRKGSKSAAVAAQVEEKLNEQSVREAEETAKDISEVKKESLQLHKAIRKLVAHSIAEARRNNRAMSTIGNDMKALAHAATVVKISREESYIILGIDPDEEIKKRHEDNLTDLEVRTLTDEEIRMRTLEAGNSLGDDDLLGLAELVEDDLGDIPTDEEADTDELDALMGYAEELAAKTPETPAPAEGTAAAPPATEGEPE